MDIIWWSNFDGILILLRCSLGDLLGSGGLFASVGVIVGYDFRLDIEVYDEDNGHPWVQGKYLVHGYSDVMWTDDLDQAIAFLRDEIRIGEEAEKEHKSHD